MKLRENNLRVTEKYYVIVPYSNCEADVPSFPLYRIGNYMGVKCQSLYDSEATSKMKQLEVEGGMCPSAL